VQEEMPPCEDWTAVPIHEKLVNMVSRISGRIFVGPELCHDPEYLDCATTYTIDMMEAQRAIKKLRPFSKPFFAPQLPEVKRLRERTKRAKQFMEPIILARLLNTEKNDEKWEKPDDLLQWFISRYSEQDTWSVEKLVRFQLHVIFAATETTSSTVTQM
jgi:cytochrome P450